MFLKIFNFLFSLTFALAAAGQSLQIPADTSITTHHQVTIRGNEIDYSATTGTIPLWDHAGQPIAAIHYTYYKKQGEKNMAERPLLISFNGGPGSASVWMHIAYTGPRLLNIDEEGYPIQPYGIRENPYSILDVADILYVNPVNTGFSRTIPISGEDVDRKKFFGINADIKYLARWLNTFVTRYERWLSPKYLIGESYGGTRVAGLALELQNAQWMYLNGVILVSPADYHIYKLQNPIYAALNLPYFTATAWYHHRLADDLQQRDLLDILPAAETFAVDTLMPALAKGGFLDSSMKKTIAQRMAYFSALPPKSILQYNLAVPTAFFWKELLRDETGFTIGRLDSRYRGLDKIEASNRPEQNQELSAWLHAFTPAINQYYRTELDFKTDMKYNMFGNVHPWDKQKNTVRDDLRKAMAQNPFLNVLFQSGYYDGATTYFHSKYSMWQIDPSGKMKDRLQFHAYRSGHMMYLRKEDLKSASEDLRNFILSSLPKGKPAKY